MAAFAATRGETTGQDAQQLADRLETALQGSKKSAPADNSSSAPDLAGLHAKLHFIVVEQDTRAAKKLVKDLSAPSLSKEAQELGAAWIKQVERDQYNRQKRLGNAIQSAVAKAGTACRAAHEESDLKELLRNLSNLKEDLENDPSPQDMDPAFQTMLVTATQAVSSWQDYLAFQKAGYEKQAEVVLAQITNFVNGRAHFAGARNVEAVLNGDGSIDLAWENVSDNIREIRVTSRPKTGEPVTIATLSPETTSYHVPPPGTTKSFPKGLDGPIVIETIPK